MTGFWAVGICALKIDNFCSPPHLKSVILSAAHLCLRHTCRALCSVCWPSSSETVGRGGLSSGADTGLGIAKGSDKVEGQMASCSWLDLPQSTGRGCDCFSERFIKNCFLSVNAEDVCVVFFICFCFFGTHGEEWIWSLDKTWFCYWRRWGIESQLDTVWCRVPPNYNFCGLSLPSHIISLWMRENRGLPSLL